MGYNPWTDDEFDMLYNDITRTTTSWNDKNDERWISSKTAIHNILTLVNTPNSQQLVAGKDKGIIHPVGSDAIGAGVNKMKAGLRQTVDYSDVDISYDYNILGLRGPHPEQVSTDKKILFIGGSLVFGTGIRYEDSFAQKLSESLGANHINLSPANDLIDLFEPMESIIENWKPEMIIVSDTRGITMGDWFSKAIMKKLKYDDQTMMSHDLRIADKEMRYGFKKSTTLARRQIMYMFFNTLDLYGIPIILINSQQRLWKSNSLGAVLADMERFKNTKIINIPDDLVIDLARDNHHYGPKSHTNITNLILSAIDPSIQVDMEVSEQSTIVPHTKIIEKTEKKKPWYKIW